MSEHRKLEERYLTTFERMTLRILTFFYKSIFWFFIPLTIIIFIVDGFNISIIVFLCIVLFIFIPIYKQNEKRLKTLIQIRMEKEKDDENEKISSEIQKSTEENMIESISMNVGINSFLGTFCSLIITILFIWSHGWSSSITRFFIVLTIFLLAVSIWLPYSPFLKREISVANEMIRVGKRLLHKKEILQMEYDECSGELNVHLTYTNEPLKLLVEKKDRALAKEVLHQWCEREHIVFVEKT